MFAPRHLLPALVAVLYSLPGFPELLLTPQEIEFRDISQSQKFFVTHAGMPLPPGDITSIVSGVHKQGDEVFGKPGREQHFSDYSYMFKFETGADGSITVTADRELLQIGSYELYVHTVHGTVTGRIEANLADTNPTRPGIGSHIPRITYTPGQTSFVYGQAISIRLSSDKVNTYSWYVDGKVHSSGLGLTSLRAWPDPGEHEISVVARNPGGDIISEWSDTFDVVEEQALVSRVRKGDKVRFKAPAGYARVTWRYDGKLISDNSLERSARDVQSITFKKRGDHILSCKAQESADGNFRLITWSISVD